MISTCAGKEVDGISESRMKLVGMRKLRLNLQAKVHTLQSQMLSLAMMEFFQITTLIWIVLENGSMECTSLIDKVI